jgi:hypothetical protein
MTYNILSNTINILTPDDISIKTDISNNIFISKTLHNYITELKKQIDQYNNEWDNIKRYINPYEFIHTKIPGERFAICKYIPVSRSFFKLIEIYHCFTINKYINNIKPKSLHLAEAPGGFIEATSFYTKIHNIEYDLMVGISLLNKNDNSTPLWNNGAFDKYKSVILENNPDSNYDMTDYNTFNYLKKKYADTYFNIITADGGFDFSSDFNNQEIQSQPLILAEILYAISFQEIGGIFILKMFDCFTLLTVQYLYLLTSFYEKVYIYKPNTSRLANSERYIICINYINTLENRNNFIKVIPELLSNSYKLKSILKIDIPLYFYQRIEEINAILGQQQLEAISSTISLITHKTQKEKLVNLKENNIQKCIAWCTKHNFNYNKI